MTHNFRIRLPFWGLFCFALVPMANGAEPSPLTQRPPNWERRTEPILSAYTTRQNWCRVVLYSPHVIFHEDKFRMWYLGTSTGTRTNDIVLGYAESTDGATWKLHDKNPILTGQDIPWGTIVQTPFVMFDHEERIFKMWFVSGQGVQRDEKNQVVKLDQQLGYATSHDGLTWKVHPKPLYSSGRSPSVIKEGPNSYRMWMGSNPGPGHPWNAIYQNIYEFTSQDGIQWKRSEQPVITPSGHGRSVVYPFVLKLGGQYQMWYGCHVAGGMFEIFRATSKDGTHWKVHHEKPDFPAAKGKATFDSRYTSTPCVVHHKNKLLMYYSARDWKTEYTDNQGRKRRDGSSPYAHIGLATLENIEETGR